jgi:hypothetical protein
MVDKQAHASTTMHGHVKMDGYSTINVQVCVCE